MHYRNYLPLNCRGKYYFAENVENVLASLATYDEQYRRVPSLTSIFKDICIAIDLLDTDINIDDVVDDSVEITVNADRLNLTYSLYGQSGQDKVDYLMSMYVENEDKLSSTHQRKINIYLKLQHSCNI